MEGGKETGGREGKGKEFVLSHEKKKEKLAPLRRESPRTRGALPRRVLQSPCHLKVIRSSYSTHS